MLCWCSKVSDNFTGIEIMGVMFFKNDWKFSWLEIWHYYCFIYEIEEILKIITCKNLGEAKQ